MTQGRLAGRDEVRARAEELRSRRERFVSATVVRAERPTSAKPGDCALVLDDGTLVGFVGGDCAAATVRAHALSALASAEPVLLRISPAGETTGASTPSTPSTPSTGGTVTVHNPCLSGGTLELFLEPVVPPPLIVVHGTAPIAVACSGLAERLGYTVTPWTGTALPADASAVVVASHGRDELAALTAAVRAGTPYIGLVASRRRGAAVVAALDLDDADRARIHTPAGIDIGARSPGEVALSILAEIVASWPRPDRQDVQEDGVPSSPGASTTSAVDPVCGMTVAALDTSPHAEVEGVRYWFCGSGCQRAFVAGPSGFVDS
jgi:xanthine dehydrogenase accessory factor